MLAVLSFVMIASFLICGIFQLLRMRKTKSSKDVSLWFVGLITLGVFSSCSIMIITGASMNLLIPQCIDVFLSLLVFLGVIYYRKERA